MILRFRLPFFRACVERVDRFRARGAARFSQRDLRFPFGDGVRGRVHTRREIVFRKPFLRLFENVEKFQIGKFERDVVQYEQYGAELLVGARTQEINAFFARARKALDHVRKDRVDLGILGGVELTSRRVELLLEFLRGAGLFNRFSVRIRFFHRISFYSARSARTFSLNCRMRQRPPAFFRAASMRSILPLSVG